TQAEQHAALSRQLSDIRLQEVRAQPGEGALEKFDQFASGFSDAAEPLNGLVSETTEIAISLRESLLGRSSQTQSDGSYIDDRAPDEAAPAAPAVDQNQGMVGLRTAGGKFPQIAGAMKAKIDDLLAAPPLLANAKARRSFETWKTRTHDYLARLPAVSQELAAWDAHRPVPA